MSLIQIKNNKPTTTSLQVAEYFKKNHAKVLRDIRLILDHDTRANFGLSGYKDKSGKENSMYIIDKDGFILLAMGFTGKKAFEFKKAYIKAFNEMEKQISQPKELTRKELAQLIIEAENEKELLIAENQQKDKAIGHLATAFSHARQAKAKEFKTIDNAIRADLGRSINQKVLKHFAQNAKTQIDYQNAHRNAWQAYFQATGQKYNGEKLASYPEKLDFLKYLNTL